MAGLYFGKSRWDDLPGQLGLTVDEDGRMRGTWKGVPMTAHFYNQYDRLNDSYHHHTGVRTGFDAPLGVQGLESAELWNLIVDPRLQADFHARSTALRLSDAFIGDGGIAGTWFHYESGVERYRAAFDLFAETAQIVLDRRAKNPPPWELEILAKWPALAQGWGLQLDARRGAMWGPVRGRSTSVAMAMKQGGLVTRVEVAAPMPAGCELSLARQDGGDGFFARLFRGQDIVIGDPVFDATFIIKGEPETFVRAALTAEARRAILSLKDAGCSFSLEDGKVVAWARSLITDRERIDALMKSAFAAATALCPEPPAFGLTPYR